MLPTRRTSAGTKKQSIEQVYFECLFDKVSEAIALCDNDGFVSKINAEFRRMFGYTRAESHGRHIDDLVAPDSERSEAAALTKTAARGETFSTESLRRRKDGKLIHVSIIGAPVLVHGKQVAVYGIYRDISRRKHAEEALLESQRQTMETYAALQLRTIELERANALLEALSNQDALTSIPNRRHFESLYQTEWKRACRTNSWISLVMVDVDFFKEFNDHNGHVAGDTCLRRVAQALSDGNRTGDLVARYGGEEFVALLLDTSRGGALEAANRMRSRVKSLAIVHGHSTVSPWVSVSLGVASQIADIESDPMSLLQKADQALYLAKTRGRDRVGLAE